MNAKQVAVVVVVFGLGLAAGKYGGSAKTPIRDRFFPVEGLSLDNVALIEREGTRNVKIATISHTTPSGIVRYGRGTSELQNANRIRIDGTFCGEKITMFGEIRDEVASRE